MASKMPSTIEKDGNRERSPKLKVELAISKQVLHQALMREKPTQPSREVLSNALCHYRVENLWKGCTRGSPKPKKPHSHQSKRGEYEARV